MFRSVAPLLSTLFLVSCASRPGVMLAPNTVPWEAISNLEREIGKGRESHVDMLAKKEFSRAVDALKDAKRAMANKENGQEVLDEVTTGFDALKLAEQKAHVRANYMHAVMDSRDSAREVGAHTYPLTAKKFEELDKEFADDARDAEDLKVVEVSRLQREYLALEVKVIADEALGLPATQIIHAKKLGAESIAPDALKRAQLAYFNAENQIAANRNAAEFYDDAVEEAYESAARLNTVILVMKGPNAPSDEMVAARIAEQDLKISELERKLAHSAPAPREESAVVSQHAPPPIQLKASEEKPKPENTEKLQAGTRQEIAHAPPAPRVPPAPVARVEQIAPPAPPVTVRNEPAPERPAPRAVTKTESAPVAEVKPQDTKLPLPPVAEKSQRIELQSGDELVDSVPPAPSRVVPALRAVPAPPLVVAGTSPKKTDIAEERRKLDERQKALESSPEPINEKPLPPVTLQAGVNQSAPKTENIAEARRKRDDEIAEQRRKLGERQRELEMATVPSRVNRDAPKTDEIAEQQRKLDDRQRELAIVPVPLTKRPTAPVLQSETQERLKRGEQAQALQYRQQDLNSPLDDVRVTPPPRHGAPLAIEPPPRQAAAARPDFAAERRKLELREQELMQEERRAQSEERLKRSRISTAPKGQPLSLNDAEPAGFGAVPLISELDPPELRAQVASLSPRRIHCGDVSNKRVGSARALTLNRVSSTDVTSTIP